MSEPMLKPLPKMMDPIGGEGDYMPLGVKVYQVLRDAIINGDLNPGVTLTETDLAETLEVSRTPVREALRLLHKQRLVARERGRGHVVSVPSEKDIREIYEIRQITEVGGLWKASKNSSQLRDELESYVDVGRLKLHQGKVVELRDLNNKFHAALAAQIKNDRLYEYYLSVQTEISRLRLYSIQDEAWANRSISEHGHMCELIRNGDFDAAAYELEKHLKDAEMALLDRFK